MTRQNSCAWCVSTEGARWDQYLAEGVPLSAVAALTPFSEATGRIHARDHLDAPTDHQPVALTAQPGPITVEEFARRLVEIATGTVSLTNTAEETGDADGMLAAVESRAEVTDMLADTLDLRREVAEGLFSEAEATVRGLHRLKLSGLPTDPETLAWFVRDAGGSLVADVIEESARMEWHAA